MPRVHHLLVVGVDIIRPDPRATVEPESAAQEEDSEDSSSSDEPLTDVEELRWPPPQSFGVSGSAVLSGGSRFLTL